MYSNEKPEVTPGTGPASEYLMGLKGGEELMGEAQGRGSPGRKGHHGVFKGMRQTNIRGLRGTQSEDAMVHAGRVGTMEKLPWLLESPGFS